MARERVLIVRRGAGGCPRLGSFSGLLALSVVCAALGLLCGSVARAQTGTGGPGKYQGLYREIDRALAAFEARAPRPELDTAITRGAAWTAAACERAEAQRTVNNRDRALRELDALHRAGVRAVVLPVCYPLLTPAYHDARPFLEHYTNLANEVRLRGMELLVRHDTMSASTAHPDMKRYFAALTLQRFEQERYLEAKSILYALQPDYLELVSDPRESAGLRLTEKDWSRYLEHTSEQLVSAVGDFETFLGAGLGLGEDLRYLDAWSAVRGLQFIDLRLAPQRRRGPDPFDRLPVWAERVRTVAPGKRVLATDVWLDKVSPTDPAVAAGDANALARDVFGFWAPLDERYLRLVARLARAKQIEWVAVSRPQYLFAYLDYLDPLTFKVSARTLLELQAQRADAAMAEGALTPTGRAFGGL